MCIYDTISLLLVLTLQTDRSGPWMIANHPVKVVVPPSHSPRRARRNISATVLTF